MRGIAALFIGTGALLALVGMGWGVQMSASQDHTLSPAHGHLNLIGFVAMSIFGIYYALTPSAAASVLARAHYALMIATVAILVPGIVMAITETGEVLAKIGSIFAILSMALFVFVVIRHSLPGGQRMHQPAE